MPESCASCNTCAYLELIELWDGKHYCHNCVTAASPRLMSECLTGDALSETFTYPPFRLAVRWFLFFAASWSCLWLSFPLISILGGKIDFLDSLYAWAMISAFALPILPLFSLAIVIGYLRDRPTVTVAAGQLTVTQKARTECVPLADCEWFDGKISNMTALQNTAILQNRVLILALPVADDGLSYSVAVGVTEESYEVWRAFLKLSKVPHRLAARSSSKAKSILKVVAVLLAFPLGFVAFMFLGRLVSDVLLLAVPDAGLSKVVGTLVFVLGFLTALMYGSILLAGSDWRRVPTRRSENEQFRTIRATVGRFVLVTTVMIVLPIAFTMKDLSLTGKTVGIVLACAWSIAIGYDFGRRKAKFDWAPASSSAGTDVP